MKAGKNTTGSDKQDIVTKMGVSECPCCELALIVSGRVLVCC